MYELNYMKSQNLFTGKYMLKVIEISKAYFLIDMPNAAVFTDMPNAAVRKQVTNGINN
jgi:hypothetical protein